MIPFALSLMKPFDKLKANGFRFRNKSCRINKPTRLYETWGCSGGHVVSAQISVQDMNSDELGAFLLRKKSKLEA